MEPLNNTSDFGGNTFKPIHTNDDNSETLDFNIENFGIPLQLTSHISSNKINAFDVSAYILKKLGQVSSMKLHKLLYYCQAWSLVWDDEPLFENEIEAWSNGPVVRDIFNYHRGHFMVDNSTFYIGNGNLLSDKQKETVDSVLKYYGDKTSQWLIELTHLEDPWKDARIGLSPNDKGNIIISLNSMVNYYSSL